MTALALVAGACTGGAEPSASSSPSMAPVRGGGTLRIGSPDFTGSVLHQPRIGLDPQKPGFYDSLELFRCCLLRTLLSYNGRPTAEGGAILRPDLAASMPTVSDDGLTWTFRLKPGLRYAPPLEHVVITSQDVIRALYRVAELDVNLYHSVIQGFDAYVAGEADAISGLEAPDSTTLRVHLVRPAGDLGERFSLPSTAPIPPNPGDPAALLGVAMGHDEDYGGFVVASGPYMLEGSGGVDFSLPPDQQRRASGVVPGTSITLVRNPSWDPESDALRGAYVERIEIALGGTIDEAAQAVDEGRLDLVFYPGPPPQAPADQVQAYEADPSKGTVAVEPRDFVRYVAINLAIPPLDDIHVRRAMNLIVDKARLQEIRGGPMATSIIGHIAMNSLENNLLLNYDPYATPGNAGGVVAARGEMALSTYDADGDGICDASACTGVFAIGFDDSVIPGNEDLSRQIQRDLRQIGIRLDLRLMPPSDTFALAADPTNHVALFLTLAWGKDLLNASDYLEPLFAGRSIGSNNFSLLGATRTQLRGWGYPVTGVPSVDDRIDACVVRTGTAQLRCWVDLDQYLMENIVPWIPYFSETHTQVVPSRIVRYSYDQFANLPALDQIALEAAG